MIENYVGDSYRSDLNGQWSENVMYEFIRLTTGKIIFDNPKFRFKTRRPGVQKQIAMVMQHGLNRWARDTNLRRLLKRVYATQCFSFSCVQTVIERQPWEDPREPAQRYWPQCYMLESERFFFDPLCTSYGGARFAGHKFVRDFDDLLEEAEESPELGWNADAVKALGKDAGTDNLKRGSDRMSITRNELVLYEVWVPEYQMQDPEMGYHGALFTIAASPSGDEVEYLREPRPFYGPRWGPYTLFGVYPVPGDPYPLSPFQATRQQGQELNDIVRAINKAIREYRRAIVCSAENPDLAMKLKKPDNTIIMVKGFNKDQIVPIEHSGITDQHLKQLELGLARVDRNTGITQTERGKITGATATEIAVQDSAAESSLSYIKQEFTDAVVQLGTTGAWGMYHDDRITFPLGEEIATQLGMVEPWFQGGEHFSQTGEKFEDLECEIEPYSMERLNEALLRAQYAEMMALAIESAAVIPMAPFYDWKKLFDKGGEVMNDPAFGEFYNPAMGQQTQMMAIQSQMVEQQQGQADVEGQQASTERERVGTAVDMQGPSLERAKIGVQREGNSMKAQNDAAKIRASAKKPKGRGK